MTQFRIDRIRFTWRGTWNGTTVVNSVTTVGTSYVKDDIVRYGGKSYVCLIGNVAGTSFYTDLAAGNWTLWFDGYSWQGAWQNGTAYNLGDIVAYDSVVYICNTPHTSVASNLPLNITGVSAGTPSAGNVTYSFSPMAIQPFLANSTVTTTGFTPSGYNGTFTVSSATLSSVVVPNATVGSVSVYGTVSGLIQAGLEYNQSYWSVYASTDDWNGYWATNTRYKVDDIVKYGGITYRCTSAHVSSALLETDIANWATVVQTDKWTTEWQISTHYRLDDIVRYGGTVYRCISAHTSANNITLGLEFNQSNWQTVISGVQYLGIWVNNTRYKNNDVVKYGANAYICTYPHTAGSTFNPSYFSLYIPGEEYRNSWNASLNYAIGDIVKYGGYSYLATAPSINVAPSTLGGWQLLTLGYTMSEDWNSTAQFQTGDVVRRNGQLYVSIADSLGQDPNAAGSTYWTLIVSGSQWQNKWASGNNYAIGDVATYYATAYRCLTAHTASGSNSPLGNGAGYWAVYIQGDHFEVLQNQGDITSYTNTQVAVPIGTPGMVLKSNGTQVSWQQFGLINNVYYVSNVNGVDAPGYGLTMNAPFKTVAYACQYVGAGIYYTNTAYLLNANKQWLVSEMFNWMNYNSIHSSNGFTPSSTYDPYKTQRDAEYIIDGIIYDITRGGNSQSVANAYMFFQPGTNFFYDSGVSAEISYFISSLTFLSNLMTSNVINNIAPGSSYQALTGASTAHITVTGASGTGSTATLTFSTLAQPPFSIGETITVANVAPIDYNGTYVVTSVSTSSVSYSSLAVAAYSSASTGSITGSAINQTINTNYVAEANASSVVSSLMNIIINALTNASTASIPPTNSGITSTINIKDGTYNEVLPITVPENTAIVGDELRNTIIQPSVANATFTGSISGTTLIISTTAPFTGSISIGMWVTASGIYTPIQITGQVSGTTGLAGTYTVSLSQTIASTSMTASYSAGYMFYVRNGSGIRNMTLSGLNGGLSPANAYLTKRPTAGAYVSLDPGKGPYDSSAWIFRKSPYVQNVTTFGTGCSGLKLDGNLHNGGNKSVVANDFTQVLSDGIGVWVTGSGALTELVSVFTYYCHAGYLAEAGAKIRATNGNSSYGTYGVVSEGYDTTEVPISCTVFNRYYQAQVASAFAGQAQNKILLLEFANCGTTYTSASYTFAGAGTQANAVQSEFRDNAVFETHLTGATLGLGGSGYITAGNQAQGGTSTTITIATNDQFSLTNYQGMRIIIISGTGVGQYGYVQAYNTVSKVITVFTESTGVAGWDHVVPGTPIVSTLDTTTQYSIEPRPIWTSPGFASTVRTLPTSNSWSSVAYGNGTFIAIDNISGVTATSTDGQTWAPGTSLPTFATWTSVIYGGTVWVAISAGPGNGTLTSTTTAAYSSNNGVTWNNATLPSSQTWSAVAYGNGTFVAIANNGTATATSSTGTSWSAGGALPTGTWVSIAYNPISSSFVAISSSGNYAAYSTNNGASWTLSTTQPSAATWASVTWGNGKLVAISTSGTATTYSFDGITWYAGNNLPQSATWTQIAYGQGLFVAVASNTTACAVSQDGLNWTPQVLAISALWNSVAFGNPTISGTITPIWTAVSGGAITPSQIGCSILTGATTKGRLVVSSSAIFQVKIWEPGSGYASAPTMTIVDPNIALNSGTNATTICRLGTGVLAQPYWINRGIGYQTSTTTVSITGNGYADILQGPTNLIVTGITGSAPTPGANMVISGINTQYNITTITQLNSTTYLFTLSINLDNSVQPANGTPVTIRIKYSQARLTGHDFLYIGTGNFSTTNYPNVNISTALQNQQIQFNNGGRVFLTSTDQDGNFKVGNLFGVQQATGIVTVNASLFNLNGVTSLSLGGVSIGQNAVIISQFSTDSYFVANSDAIIPTQKAIKSYVARAISTGGSAAQTGTAVSGIVGIGQQNNVTADIFTTTGTAMYIGRNGTASPNKVLFAGNGQGVPTGIDGGMLAMAFFSNSFGGSQL